MGAGGEWISVKTLVSWSSQDTGYHLLLIRNLILGTEIAHNRQHGPAAQNLLSANKTLFAFEYHVCVLYFDFGNRKADSWVLQIAQSCDILWG